MTKEISEMRAYHEEVSQRRPILLSHDAPILKMFKIQPE
jgi:hypothetical protein